MRVLTGLEAGKAQVFSRNIKRPIARVLEAGTWGDPLPPGAVPRLRYADGLTGGCVK